MSNDCCLQRPSRHCKLKKKEKIHSLLNLNCLLILKNYFQVTFLLEHGADPNEKALCGATALHFASECGHRSIVKVLLKFGAKIMKNAIGMTPIIVAAERTRSTVVGILIAYATIEEKIEAYELLGASFANDKDNYCVAKAYHYLHQAMELR